MSDTARHVRRRLIIGVSHKMYFSSAQTRQWCTEVADLARAHPRVVDGDIEVFVVPGALDTAWCAAELPPLVRVGVQNISEHLPGPWTGEISAASAAEVGCSFAEIGHAERRRHFGETDAVVAQKVLRALEAGLTPLVCVGEAERVPASEAIDVVRAQIDAALHRAEDAGVTGSCVLFAYEPVWAIGASEAADADHIRAVGGPLRETIHELSAFPGSHLIYGGSAGPGLLENVARSVDGLFLGRYAHDPCAVAAVLDEAAAIVSAWNAERKSS